MAWSDRFSDPVPLPEGGELFTLRDAGAYITKLPKQVRDTTPWQIATHLLIEAADQGRPVELGRLGMMLALFQQIPSVHRSRDKTQKSEAITN